jgi:hypothetical protein
LLDGLALGVAAVAARDNAFDSEYVAAVFITLTLSVRIRDHIWRLTRLKFHFPD